VRLWDLSAGKAVAGMGVGTVHKACWFDGERGAVFQSHFGEIQRGEFGSQPVRLLFRGQINGRDPTFKEVAVRPGSKQIAVVLEGKARPEGELLLADAASDKMVRTFAPPALPAAEKHTPYCCSFMADGSRLVSGEKNGKVRVWETDTGKLLYTLDGRDKEIHQIECSPTGSQALVYEQAGHVWVLDLKRHTQESPYPRQAELRALAFSPDGRHFVTASGDRTVRIWGLPAVKD
jgi:WD40 repeat protein